MSHACAHLAHGPVLPSGNPPEPVGDPIPRPGGLEQRKPPSVRGYPGGSPCSGAPHGGTRRGLPSRDSARQHIPKGPGPASRGQGPRAALRAPRSRRPGLHLAVLSLAFGVLACERSWDAMNRSFLRRDLARLCEIHGVRPRLRHCRMVGATREGVCCAPLDPADVARLVRGLGLVRIETPEDHPQVAHILHRAGLCTPTGDQPSGREVFAALGRPPSLRLPGGTAFHHLVLVVSEGGSRTCFIACYAYG